jgi:ring-1,2-phenylacetyl-CoA epoxidase subunit PaaC
MQMALFQYILRIADNALILGQRLSELTTKGPFLEEQLALSNIALDTLGTAQLLLDYAAKVEDKGRTEDDLAYFRTERDFYNTLLVEQPNGDYAKVMLRQHFIDTFNVLFYTHLSHSKDQILGGIAQKALKEANYHYRHSSMWVIRFGDGTEESKQRLQEALKDLWKFHFDLFDEDDVEKAMLDEEIINVSLQSLYPQWIEKIQQIFAQANLTIPSEYPYKRIGGKKGQHSEYLGYILSEMQSLARAHPDARW